MAALQQAAAEAQQADAADTPAPLTKEVVVAQQAAEGAQANF
jgi:hypothetical protein